MLLNSAAKRLNKKLSLLRRGLRLHTVVKRLNRKLLKAGRTWREGGTAGAVDDQGAGEEEARSRRRRFTRAKRNQAEKRPYEIHGQTADGETAGCGGEVGIKTR